jgi:hypothetical protein
MALNLTGISNENEFYTHHYLSAILESDLIFAKWSAQELQRFNTLGENDEAILSIIAGPSEALPRISDDGEQFLVFAEVGGADFPDFNSQTFQCRDVSGESVHPHSANDSRDYEWSGDRQTGWKRVISPRSF